MAKAFGAPQATTRNAISRRQAAAFALGVARRVGTRGNLARRSRVGPTQSGAWWRLRAGRRVAAGDSSAAIAYALPRLAAKLSAGSWWALAQSLRELAIDAQQLRADVNGDVHELLRQQLLAAELPLAPGLLVSRTEADARFVGLGTAIVHRVAACSPRRQRRPARSASAGARPAGCLLDSCPFAWRARKGCAVVEGGRSPISMAGPSRTATRRDGRSISGDGYACERRQNRILADARRIGRACW